MPPLPWPRTRSFSKSESRNSADGAAADEEEDVEHGIIVVVGGGGDGGRGNRRPHPEAEAGSGISRVRLRWGSLRSRTMAMEKREVGARNGIDRRRFEGWRLLSGSSVICEEDECVRMWSPTLRSPKANGPLTPRGNLR